MKTNAANRAKIFAVMDHVALLLRLGPTLMRTRTRKADIVSARYVAFLYCRDHLGIRPEEIANALMMDHSTVIHGFRRAKQIVKDEKYRATWALLRDHGVPKTREESQAVKHEIMIELFKRHMLAQMYANDYRNGGDGQYRPHKDINTHDPAGVQAMLRELRANVDDFEKALYGEGQIEHAQEQVATVLALGADVANMAMLLTYDTGALRSMPQQLPDIEKGELPK